MLKPGVLAHGRRSVEGFSTDVTRVRPFPSVRPDMFFNMALQFVSIPTDGTGVWFLVVVGPQVVHQLMPGLCLFATDTAREHSGGGR